MVEHLSNKCEALSSILSIVTCTQIHSHRHTDTHIDRYTYKDTHRETQTHTHTHTHTHTDTDTHTLKPQQPMRPSQYASRESEGL